MTISGDALSFSNVLHCKVKPSTKVRVNSDIPIDKQIYL